MMTEAEVTDALQNWRGALHAMNLMQDVEGSRLASTYVAALEMVLRGSSGNV